MKDATVAELREEQRRREAYGEVERIRISKVYVNGRRTFAVSYMGIETSLLNADEVKEWMATFLFRQDKALMDR